MSTSTTSPRSSANRPTERNLESRPSGATDLAYALVYPNRHALGAATLGFQSVGGLLSGLPGALCHRAFADYPRTLEAERELSRYDVVALSLSFEGDYPEALRLLAEGRVPLHTAERTREDPVVIAGGVAVSLNPEPLAPFLDAVFVGEAEAGLADLHAFLRAHRGAPRPDLLRHLADARLPGVYVPSRYDCGGEGCVPSPRGNAPPTVERRWAPLPWDPARTRVLAEDDAFSGAYLIEVSRGCGHACRFCAAGYATRPARFLPRESLEPHVRFGAREAGKVGFVGAAVSDHPDLPALARVALAEGAGFSVSSFRAENLTPDFLDLLVRGGLQTLTVALEAGTERLRRLLGKGITEADLLVAARRAREAGLRNLRIYAMVGLPGEADEDVEELARAAVRAREAMGAGMVTLSVAPFVPKAHTPFQWEPMAPEGVLRSRLRRLQSLCGRERGVRAVGEAPKWSRVQGLLSRGTREVATLLEVSLETGDWRGALRSPLALRTLAGDPDLSERLPWGFLRGVPAVEHLRRERESALRGAPPLPCHPGECRACGVC